MVNKTLKLTAIVIGTLTGLTLLGYLATEIMNPKPSMTVYSPEGRLMYKVFNISAEQVRKYRESETKRGNRIQVENADRLR
jgi:hypothetical protein